LDHYFTFSNLIISLYPGLKSEIRKYWSTKKNVAAGGRRKRISPGRNFTRPVTRKQNIF